MQKKVAHFALIPVILITASCVGQVDDELGAATEAVLRDRLRPMAVTAPMVFRR